MDYAGNLADELLIRAAVHVCTNNLAEQSADNGGAAGRAPVARWDEDGSEWIWRARGD